MSISTATPCLCSMLRRATRSVTRRYDDALRPLELRITQFSLLRQLVRHGEQRMRDLATRVVLEETALNRAVRGLESRGWVAIRPGKDDKRERLLSITAVGRKLLAEAEPRWLAAQQEMTDELGPTWDTLLRGLGEVVDRAAP